MLRHDKATTQQYFSSHFDGSNQIYDSLLLFIQNVNTTGKETDGT